MAASRETKQKELIRNEMGKFSSFFTGEDLFNKVKTKNNKIGIATVYRFLNNLKNKKEIHSYNCNRKILYSNSKKSHCHFICENCNKTEHIKLDKIDFLKNKIKDDICHFQIDVYGVCEHCRKKI